MLAVCVVATVHRVMDMAADACCAAPHSPPPRHPVLRAAARGRLDKLCRCPGRRRQPTSIKLLQRRQQRAWGRSLALAARSAAALLRPAGGGRGIDIHRLCRGGVGKTALSAGVALCCSRDEGAARKQASRRSKARGGHPGCTAPPAPPPHPQNGGNANEKRQRESSTFEPGAPPGMYSSSSVSFFSALRAMVANASSTFTSSCGHRE